jgi:hypothetical protein
MQAKAARVGLFIVGSFAFGVLFRLGWEAGARVWSIL